ncbi:hypothetical protein Hamer_G003862 [Homarus americanus]|uniref:Uncharacterized protein n=1 Tax=Homarus americanus TaxID=6706 RepID=A0A8J5TNF5_HOMAM|nr:hypothetical protein Hamer_G003862 [Homarus americanus]
MVTSSLVVNCVGGLRAALASLHEVYKSKLVSLLESSTETRLNKFESVEAFRLAATLDPRYKLDWCHDYDNEVQDIRDLLTVKYNMAGSVEPTTTDTSPAEPPPMKSNSFFGLANRSSTPRPTPSETEVSLYLNQPCLQEAGDPLATGRPSNLSFPSSPGLQQSTWPFMLHRLLWNDCSPIAGKLFRPEVCNLRDKRFEQLMMIRCNPQ